MQPGGTRGWSGILSAVLIASAGGELATNPPPAVGPEIIVTATRAPRELLAVPNMACQLEPQRQTLQEGARTLPDLLSGVPSVLAQKTAYGQGSPFLRGFTGFRTLCLIDGVRLNNSVFRDGPNQYWNTVDPLALRDAEVVLGPASALYGSDAVGGTLNAIPAAPPAYAGAPTWQRRLSYRGATAEDSHVGRAQFGGRPREDFGFVGGFSYKDFGDLHGGRDVGRQRHTGYEEQDADLRMDYQPDADTTWTLGHQTVRQDDVWRTHKTIYGIAWRGLAVGDEQRRSLDQRRDLTYLKLRAAGPGSWADALEGTISRQAQGEEQFRVKRDGAADRQGFDVVTWGAALQLRTEAAGGEWVYGVETYRDTVESYTRRYAADGAFLRQDVQGPVADDATYDTVGVYVQDTWPAWDGAVDLIPGLRYSYGRADARAVQNPLDGSRMSLEDEWQTLTGSLRMWYPLARDRRHGLFAGLAQGFRAPNLSDLTRWDTARSNEIETPAPGLDPEYYLGAEAGLKLHFESWALQLCGYRTWIDGLIVRAPTGRVIDENIQVTKRNAGDGYVQGLELTARGTLAPAWSAWLSGALQDGRVESYPTADPRPQQDYLSRVLPASAEIGLRWQAASGRRWWCETVGKMAARADRLSADDRRDTQRIPPGGTPGYAVLHLRVGAALTRNLDLALAVENVFDADYRIHGSGVNEPGRNVVLTAALDF